MELKEIKDKPIFQMTGSEFMELLQSANSKAPETEKPEQIKGIANLAARLNVSPPTVQKWKNQGVIPFTQRGRFVYFDVNRVLEALNKR